MRIYKALVTDKNELISFSEQREIFLLIHDTNKDQSSQYLDQMQALLDEMIARGYNTKNIGGLIRDANVLQSIKKYAAVLLNYNKITPNLNLG